MQRFVLQDGAVTDNQTGLVWTQDASLSEFPLAWNEALGFVGELNASSFLGGNDWRLPSRRELFSLVSHETINPCLPSGHPFINVENTYYWTSTTCARLPGQAWYIHFGGARVFKGLKDASYMVWPVRVPGESQIFQPGKDSGPKAGQKPAEPRFTDNGNTVRDNATGLFWTKSADCGNGPLDWESAFRAVERMNREKKFGFRNWRIPEIAELETLVDLERHSPALSGGHPFSEVRDFYWSATTSKYDETYAWALYLRDGALGVGVKTSPEFFLWAVRDYDAHGLST